MPRSYYEVLGVSPRATEADIKRAYRALARRYHPDSHPDDPDAEARFKEVTVAYETLRDPERRRRYDMFGEEGASAVRSGAPTGDAFGLGDLFDAFFGGDAFGGRRGPTGPARAYDAEVAVELTLRDAAFGVVHTVEVRLPVTCERCDGSGCEPGTHPSRCDMCGGTGEVRQVRRSILGQMVTASPCPACDATGSRILSPCRDCRGEGRVDALRRIDVEVPAGVDSGQRLRLPDRGPAAPRGGIPGDLYVNIAVAPHPEFERHGNDLLHAHRLPFTQAALGASFAIETLDGDEEEILVPPGAQPGQVLRLKGRGVPSLHGRRRGDLLVRLDVEIPERLRPEEEELLRRLAELRGDDVAPPERGFFDRVRSAFQ
ncbi:MAG TPA: J domain-containing protein [Acidimicrobiia bacterium]|nr:J domain-containing protein [Acidimicrobiia bacterium]